MKTSAKCEGYLVEPAQPIIKSYPEKDNSALPDYQALESALIRLQKRYADLEGKLHPAQQRTWVGLTDEEAIKCSTFESRLHCVEAANDILKDKNA